MHPTDSVRDGSEADLIDQQVPTVVTDEPSEYPDDLTGFDPGEAEVADVVEQHRAVVLDDES